MYCTYKNAFVNTHILIGQDSKVWSCDHTRCLPRNQTLADSACR